jgi:hypothetical protein
MTHERDIERILDHWFADGPDVAPDRVLDAVADRIERQSQQPAWRLRLKETPVNGILKPLLAVAAVIVVAVIAYSVLPFGSRSVGGQPSASPSPSPSQISSPSAAAIVCDSGSTGCAGPLAAGAHTTDIFKPVLTFTAPDGWTNTFQTARAYNLQPPGNGFFFQVLSQVAIPEQTADCSAQRKAGVGNGVTDWVDFLTSHPGLTAGSPTPVTVGGYEAMSVSVRVDPTWTETCPEGIAPTVMLVTDSGTSPDRTTWIDDQRTTLTILDVAGETVIIRTESAPSASAEAADNETVRPLIESMQFTP